MRDVGAPEREVCPGALDTVRFVFAVWPERLVIPDWSVLVVTSVMLFLFFMTKTIVFKRTTQSTSF